MPVGTTLLPAARLATPGETPDLSWVRDGRGELLWVTPPAASTCVLVPLLAEAHWGLRGRIAPRREWYVLTLASRVWKGGHDL
jgi:hypothetical protein